ncbi:replication protein A 70 kDa DNA-binding subunit-like [Leptopilina heterotoma]|uniref:replication protein A 70 kDa DNA-binding subunit-like n=1 Tax=Leptopilina heterotoma TaxID=63436 RepID=UPI001CA8F105|nr:replication protein A 70 kDa DNA-binding subunit-like [Leptopilina heterotoma]
MKHNKRNLESDDHGFSHNLNKEKKIKIDSFMDIQNTISEWVIRCKIVNKSNIKSYKSGKLFSIDLIDSSSQFRCTFFDDAVDKFFEIVQIGKQYILSKFYVSTPHPKFNVFNNRIEIQMKTDSSIKENDENDIFLPDNMYTFKTIEEIKLMETGTFTDLKAKIFHINEIEEIVLKTGTKFVKRSVTIVDELNEKIDFALWRENAQNFSMNVDDDIIIKGGKVLFYNNIAYISIINSSIITLNEGEEEANNNNDKTEDHSSKHDENERNTKHSKNVRHNEEHRQSQSSAIYRPI